MKNTYRILCLIAAAIALVACIESSQQNEKLLPLQKTPTGIDGEWVDKNGIISHFRDGVFETRAADTNEKLSEGSYHYINDKYIEMEIRSILRGTISRVDCMISDNRIQLFCISRSGLQFLLQRNIKEK